MSADNQALLSGAIRFLQQLLRVADPMIKAVLSLCARDYQPFPSVGMRVSCLTRRKTGQGKTMSSFRS